jgi:hypothetical protein
MISVLAVRDYKLSRFTHKSTPDERQSLLQNGNGSTANYGGTHDSTSTPTPARRTQVSGTGWLDYFAGFRVLFPYLWYDNGS